MRKSNSLRLLILFSLVINFTFIATNSPAQVTINTATSSTTNDFSFSVPSGDDRLLIVHAVLGNNGGTPSISQVTIGGTPLTLSSSQAYTVSGVPGISDGLSTVWYLPMGSNASSEPAANISVTVTLGNFSGLGVTVFNGVDQTAPISGSSTSLSSTTTTSSQNVGSNSDNMIFDAISFFTLSGGLSLPGGSGQTAAYNFSSGSSIYIGGSFEPGAAAVLMDWNVTNPSEVGGGAHHGFDINQAAPVMPVELAAFKAIGYEKSVELSWETITETDNDGFAILRSQDGKDWEQLTFIPGQGTTTSSHTYSYTDDNPHPGTSYYRLKQIDYDGQFTHSNILAVSLTKDLPLAVLNVYPNPTHQELYYSLSEAKNNTSLGMIRIYNQSGQVVKKDFPDDRPFLSVENLQPGLYWIEYTDGNERLTTTFFKR